MILPALLFFCFCAGKPAELKARVMEVAEGSDVSLSCSSDTDESPWLRHKLNTILKLNTTEYLLIKDFQNRDVGYYDCNSGTHRQTFQLELKYGSTSEQLIFFRASEGDSVFFSCKTLSASSIKATWFWTSHESSKTIKLNQRFHHFNNRLWFRNKENDFSLKISPVQWSDSGKYSCNQSAKARPSVFELVLVRVSADPLRITLGHSVLLKCELSHLSKDFDVLWMNTDMQETFSNPLEVKGVALSQQNWTCGVFYSSVLRAVFPLTLNITHAFTTSPLSPTHLTTHTEPETLTHTAAATTAVNRDAGQSLFIIIGVFISFILILIAVATAVRCTKTPEERKDGVIYAEVIFRKKSDASTEPQLNSNNVPAEEELEVFYTTIHSS